MAKRSQSRSKSFKGHAAKGSASAPLRTGPQGTRFVDRQLLGVNPLREQFEPTDAEPINGHKREAGIG